MTRPRRGRAHPLSPRELQAVRYAAVLGRKGAAAALGVSEDTIAEHLARAYRRLGAHSIASAVYALAGRGLLGDLDPAPPAAPGLPGADPATWAGS